MSEEVGDKTWKKCHCWRWSPHLVQDFSELTTAQQSKIIIVAIQLPINLSCLISKVNFNLCFMKNDIKWTLPTLLKNIYISLSIKQVYFNSLLGKRFVYKIYPYSSGRNLKTQSLLWLANDSDSLMKFSFFVGIRNWTVINKWQKFK